MCTPVKNFRISVQGIFHIPKTAKMGTVKGGVLVRKVQLKRHNFGCSKSFQGLVEIPMTCFLYVNFGGGLWFGRYKPTKNPNFGNRSMPSTK